jgi:L-methionine (R)-S-oxide reductase
MKESPLVFVTRTTNLIYLCFMAENLNIVAGTKTEQYLSVIPQIGGLIEGEPDLVANLANIVAALKEQFGWFWVGFYLVKQDELVLGPFQGPVACTRIRKGRGVCGSSWEQAKTLIVPDVEKFPGHIACSSLSKSEIVVPIIRNKEVIGVLDVDSDDLDSFDETDQQYLEMITRMIPFNL